MKDTTIDRARFRELIIRLGTAACRASVKVNEILTVKPDFDDEHFVGHWTGLLDAIAQQTEIVQQLEKVLGIDGPNALSIFDKTNDTRA